MKKLFYNGIIRTMSMPEIAEAVLTDGERIKAVGKYEELISLAEGAEKIDLLGKTMLPAFIDTHSHFSSYAMSFLQVSLEECRDFDEITEQVRSFISDNHIKSDTWITAKGYDHNALKEKRHPTLKLLDAAAPKNPLVLQHASGHVGVFNTPALKKLGITEQTQAPAGGYIGIKDDRLTGYMEENAFFSCLKQIPMPDTAEMLSAYRKAQESYASHGITTIQEGMTVRQMQPLYRFLLDKNMLKLDLVAYAAPEDADFFINAFPKSVKTYHKHFKIGGYKIMLDGSPQGRTAWMRTPYKDQTPYYYGYGTMSDEEVLKAMQKASADELQILAHCNGDAAAQQYINAVDSLKKAGGRLFRPVMIHAQLLDRNQLSEVRELGIIPSFFISHVYHWGDMHIRNFGFERASQISAAKSALSQGIIFTFHQDTPVIEPDMPETIWCAVNRLTKSGVLLGEDEKISVAEALKAVTVNAAYQYGEETEKGTIQPGKRADFVILDRDPVTINPYEIRNISVVRTIKNAEIIYSV